MLLAVRPGTDGILIPHEYRERFRGFGCQFLDAPPGYVEVTEPTPLTEARRSVESSEARAIPTPAAPPTTVPTEPQAPAPRQRRRGRGPGD